MPERLLQPSTDLGKLVAIVTEINLNKFYEAILKKSKGKGSVEDFIAALGKVDYLPRAMSYRELSAFVLSFTSFKMVSYVAYGRAISRALNASIEQTVFDFLDDESIGQVLSEKSDIFAGLLGALLKVENTHLDQKIMKDLMKSAVKAISALKKSEYFQANLTKDKRSEIAGGVQNVEECSVYIEALRGNIKGKEQEIISKENEIKSIELEQPPKSYLEKYWSFVKRDKSPAEKQKTALRALKQAVKELKQKLKQQEEKKHNLVYAASFEKLKTDIADIVWGKNSSRMSGKDLAAIISHSEDLIFNSLRLLENNPNLVDSIIDRILPDNKKTFEAMTEHLPSDADREDRSLYIADGKVDLNKKFDRARAKKTTVDGPKVLNDSLGQRLSAYDLSSMILDEAKFDNIYMQGFKFNDAVIKGCSFKGAVLLKCNFSGVNFEGTINLTDTLFDRKTFESMLPCLRRAMNSGATITFGNTKIVGDLEDLDLRGPTLSEFNLEASNTTNADFVQFGDMPEADPAAEEALPSRASSPFVPLDEPKKAAFEKSLSSISANVAKVALRSAPFLQYDESSKPTKVGYLLMKIINKNKTLRGLVEQYPVAATIITTRTPAQCAGLAFSLIVRNAGAYGSVIKNIITLVPALGIDRKLSISANLRKTIEKLQGELKQNPQLVKNIAKATIGSSVKRLEVERKKNSKKRGETHPSSMPNH